MNNEELKYQRIYEEQLSSHLKESMEMPSRFYELSHQQRQMIIELVDFGFVEAIEENLDREVLEDTALLAGDMGSQLYNFANMLNSYLKSDTSGEEE